MVTRLFHVWKTQKCEKLSRRNLVLLCVELTTVSTVNAELSDKEPTSPNLQAYKYDLRLEIGVKEAGSKVPVASIFYGLVRRLKAAADVGAPVVVLTATDKLFHENKDMSSEEFQKAFHVDNLEGKVTKVLLGFKIQSMTKLSELKRRLLHTYLIPNHLFIRPHVGGFDNGVKSYSYGFLQNDHPDHPDICMLNRRFARIVSESWKSSEKMTGPSGARSYPIFSLGPQELFSRSISLRKGFLPHMKTRKES